MSEQTYLVTGSNRVRRGITSELKDSRYAARCNTNREMSDDQARALACLQNPLVWPRVNENDLSLLQQEGQFEPECATVAGSTTEDNLSAMPFHNLADKIQSQTRPLN